MNERHSDGQGRAPLLPLALPSLLFIVGATGGCGHRSNQAAYTARRAEAEPKPPITFREQELRSPDVSQRRPFRIINNQIVTDTFQVRYDLRDGRLTLALDTDLADAAELMVSVSRSYCQQGSDTKYPVDYFSETSTVGAWREPRTIRLDHNPWKREIESAQRAMAAAGEPFTVSQIADSIEISFVIPVNQDPPFERFNANLIGDAVTQSGNLRIVQWEASVPYPIDATGIGQTRFADARNLASGMTYGASGNRPIVLCAELDPPDPWTGIASMRRLSPDTEFTVLERALLRDTPWYRVRTALGEGWINSTALLGRDIVIVRWFSEPESARRF